MLIPKINIKKTFIFHPFLFAIFPILSLFSHNIGQALFHQILMPSAIVLGLMLFLLLLFRLISRNNQKAAILTSVFLILFFSYGHIFRIMQNFWKEMDFWNLASHVNLMLTWITVFIGTIYFVLKTRKNLEKFTNILNLVSFFLVVAPIIGICDYEMKALLYSRNIDIRTTVETENIGTSTIHLKNTKDLPDIYYIILDKYTREDVLKEKFNFDNSEFINYLSDKGFYVASQSTANYPITPLSLASSLNMKYINYLTDEVGENSINWRPLYDMIKNHKVGQFLKSRGYTYIHFETGWYPTGKNEYADINIGYRSMSEFSKMLYENTILAPINLLNYRVEHKERILYKFDELAKIPNIEGPTFVFAHMLCPHQPYVFDKDGKFVSVAEASAKGRNLSYIEQLRFANKKTEELINIILSKSKIPPIIILQSDEGPYPEELEESLRSHEDYNWEEANNSFLKQKMGILNAFYLPGLDKSELRPDITPVNNFRIVFNLLFDANLELLPDQNYSFGDKEHIYKFLNVTERLSEEGRQD